jgi:hypothetical protein
MESSEEEDDFPSIESIIPQSKVDSLYQSQTEKVRFFLFHFTINNNAFLPTFLFFLFLGKGKLIWGYLHSNYIFVSEFRFAMLMFKFNQKLLQKKILFLIGFSILNHLYPMLTLLIHDRFSDKM